MNRIWLKVTWLRCFVLGHGYRPAARVGMRHWEYCTRCFRLRRDVAA